MSEVYDYVVVGTGAGGGTLLHRLAATGASVLVLERGGFLPRERENWDPREVFTHGRYQATETWVDAEGRPFRPYTHYWVGGNTKLYGGALLRLRESDFGRVDHYGGTAPAWPVGYDTFEPYYAEAEALYHAHGAAGRDPTEPRRSGPYPYAPLPYEPRMAEIAADLEAQGLRPFPCPVGVRLPDGPGPRWVLSHFDGYPDLTERKADAEVVAVGPTLAARPNVTLLTDAPVQRLETDARGERVIGALVGPPGGPWRTFRGERFVVAAGAINSAALLLRSASDRHPDGLGNRSGLVGRNLMLHNNGMLVALSEVPNPSQFQKAFALSDFYEAGPHGDRPLGFAQLMGKLDPDFLASLTEEHLAHVPVEERWRHTVDFFLTAEDLPDPENRVALAADGRIQLRYRETNREAYDRLRDVMIRFLDGAGCRTCLHHAAYVGPKLGISGVSHQVGTLRFGEDPATSVLDLWCKAHDLANLWVVDGSFFPSSGAVNPSLTIMANALRVADHLAEAHA